RAKANNARKSLTHDEHRRASVNYSLSEGSASLSDPHQGITCSRRAAASISELFAERRPSECLLSGQFKTCVFY
ncbi:hypothetical protein L195_g064090, partial [Trifolium pratense]